MPTIKMKDLVEKKKEKKESTELNESLVGTIVTLIFGKKLNDIVKQAGNDPELKKKMEQIINDIGDIKKRVENDPALIAFRKKHNYKIK